MDKASSWLSVVTSWFVTVLCAFRSISQDLGVVFFYSTVLVLRTHILISYFSGKNEEVSS